MLYSFEIEIEAFLSTETCESSLMMSHSLNLLAWLYSEAKSSLDEVVSHLMFSPATFKYFPQFLALKTFGTSSSSSFEMLNSCSTTFGILTGPPSHLVRLLCKITSDSGQSSRGLSNPLSSCIGRGKSVPKSETWRHRSCSAGTPCHG